jgi:hypothetical protein
MNHGQDPQLAAHEISRSSYEESAPRLTGQRRKIVEALRQYGPLTANELARLLPHLEAFNFNVRSRMPRRYLFFATRQIRKGNPAFPEQTPKSNTLHIIK